MADLSLSCLPAPGSLLTWALLQGPQELGRKAQALRELGPGLTVPPSLQKRYRAVYDYSAADEDEVSFQDGDTIVNVQQIDDGWMYGTVERTGDTGMLPANYVEAI